MSTLRDSIEESLLGLPSLDEQLGSFEGVERSGYVTAVTGTVIRAIVPDVRIGEICRIERAGMPPLEAEVVGFDRQDVVLLPLGRLEAIAIKAFVAPSGAAPTVPAGPAVRGRVLDAMGQPIDGLGPINSAQRAPMVAPPPNPLHRVRITKPISTGVRAIDGLLTLGRGQRVGIFAAAGVGKSTLLSMIARNVEADSVVLALIGERGREVVGFLEDDLGEEGMKKSTVVVSTSDQPALLRLKAAYTATAIAEEARRRGEQVVLMMDSVTRFARALREVGLAAGEPPGRQGYPASVFATLPTLFERAGNDEYGSITALYTVLVAGDDLEEPVADETISLLDGHIILSRKLAARGHYPAIDVIRSKSRLMDEITDKSHRAAARRAGQVLAVYEENYDKISVGVYETGSDERVDESIERIRDVEGYLRQEKHGPQSLTQSVNELETLFPDA
ncbi:MAG TPA: FliI/YscN family ATPase [Tepidisphaeraceae bacterium]|jgi:FliI/YscN family ATPase